MITSCGWGGSAHAKGARAGGPSVGVDRAHGTNPTVSSTWSSADLARPIRANERAAMDAAGPAFALGPCRSSRRRPGGGAAGPREARRCRRGALAGRRDPRPAPVPTPVAPKAGLFVRAAGPGVLYAHARGSTARFAGSVPVASPASDATEIDLGVIGLSPVRYDRNEPMDMALVVGRAVDESGRPVEGALVTAMRRATMLGDGRLGSGAHMQSRSAAIVAVQSSGLTLAETCSWGGGAGPSRGAEPCAGPNDGISVR